MDTTLIIGWIGTFTGMVIGIPQIIKSLRSRKTGDISALTFALILITSACFLLRSLAIGEYAFICYYGFIILTSSFQLWLIFRYRSSGGNTGESAEEMR